MKYVFLFCTGPEERHRWNTMPDADRTAWYNRIAQWFEVNAPVIRETHQLQGTETAHTIRFSEGGTPLVTDGPFIESSDVVGGYALVEVPDREAALALATSWPGSGPLEFRPIVDHSGA